MASVPVFKGSVPANYDHYLGPLFFEPYAVDLVKRWQTLKMHKVLELACGTGRLTRHLLQLLDLDGALYATDLNEDMLTVAREKIQDSRLHWQVVDAQELPFEDNSFDLVVCQFGVMFFPNKLKAFREALRVLQPDGTFLFLTWDDTAYNTVSFETQKVLQSVFPEDAPVFSQKGPYSYFDKDEITSSLQEAGFRNIEIIPVQLTATAAQVEDVIIGSLEGSPLTSYLAERGEAKEKVRALLQNSLSAYQIDGGFRFSMQALYCKGVK
jgi:ubiquinone/menaquinone biosynthesis C-methylase UbiE